MSQPVRRVLFFLSLCVVLLAAPLEATALTIQEDPQYVVMNFSTINELNWAADQEEWETKIKPQILAQIHELKAALPPGSPQRRLAWSTLQEYTNHPLDEPSASSYYAVKVRRILEITEEENLPVFLPLNGFQWWDELPELYNWWDPDGTNTPAVFFERQDNPEDFKRRFIAGYDPNNKWNVEWQDYTTPMNLNWRNWGGGGFRLAPPPNLVRQHRSKHNYREVQEERLKVILSEIAQKAEAWEKAGKGYLFAGITIGTEVSLNASAKPEDEFEPYGYRSIQDLYCPEAQATCGAQTTLSASRLEKLRQEAVQRYLYDLTRLATQAGLPKQRIYTHVWSEAQKGEPRHTNYAAAAFTPYSRAGISLYGFAEKPFELPDWYDSVTQNGKQAWGAVEYSADKETSIWQNGLHNVFNSEVAAAKVMVIYNWGEHKETPAMPALAAFLQQKPDEPACALSEILPSTPQYSLNPVELSWTFLSPVSEEAKAQLKLHVLEGVGKTPFSKEVHLQQLEGLHEQTSTPKLANGTYTWYIEMSGCEDHKQFSEPRIITIEAPTPSPTPFWQRWVQ